MVAESIRLGQDGPAVSRLGMGCWAIGGHGWGKVKDQDSIRAVRCAYENGITFFDTADAYGLGKSEILLAKSLGESRKQVTIASKGGVRWDDSGNIWTDISPSYLRKAVENSLKRLRIDCIPLYYIHKPDGITRIQDSVAELETLRQEGKIKAIGVSNFDKDQLVEALRVAWVSAIQVRLNIFDRTAFDDLADICVQNDINIIAWGALADGLLTGKFSSETRFLDDDHRSSMPEFQGEQFLRNLKTVDKLKKMAASSEHKLCELALRWVLDCSNLTCCLFGAKTDLQVKDNIRADGWRLSESQLSAIDMLISSTKEDV